MRECGPKISGRLPDPIVQIRWAFADRTVELGGDEARLPLHEGGVVLPDLEKGLLVRLIERKRTHQYDRAGVDGDLTLDWKAGSRGRSDMTRLR